MDENNPSSLLAFNTSTRFSLFRQLDFFFFNPHPLDLGSLCLPPPPHLPPPHLSLSLALSSRVRRSACRLRLLLLFEKKGYFPV